MTRHRSNLLERLEKALPLRPADPSGKQIACKSQGDRPRQKARNRVPLRGEKLLTRKRDLLTATGESFGPLKGSGGMTCTLIGLLGLLGLLGLSGLWFAWFAWLAWLAWPDSLLGLLGGGRSDVTYNLTTPDLSGGETDMAGPTLIEQLD